MNQPKIPFLLEGKLLNRFLATKTFEVMNPDLTPPGVIYISQAAMDELRALSQESRKPYLEPPPDGL